MRLRLFLAILIGASAAFAAPTAWAAIIKHERIGPIEIEARSALPTLQAGAVWNGEIRVTNHSATATIWVEVNSELRFADGSVLPLAPLGSNLPPGSHANLGVSASMPSLSAVGPAKFIAGARIRSISEGGVTWEPAEPTGCWDSDVFIVN